MSGATPSAAAGELGGPRIIRVLDALLHPAVQFRGSAKLALEGIDLRWLQEARAGDRAPPSALTLENVREDLFMHDLHTTGRDAHITDAALTSPRSVVVLLRNGLTVSDLQQRPLTHFCDAPAKAHEPVTRAAQHHYESRRRALLSTVRNEYRDLTLQVPLADIIEGLSELVRRRRIEAAQLARRAEVPADHQPWGMTAGARESSVRSPSFTPSPTRGPRPSSAAAEDRLAAEKARRQAESDKRMQRLQALHEAASERRTKATERAAEHAAEVVAEADKRRHVAEEHLQQLAVKRQIERQQHEEAEELKELRRRAVLAQSERVAERRHASLLQQREKRLERMDATRVAQSEEQQLRAARRALAGADKHFLGDRQRRAAEFQKLLTMATIADKTDRAERASVSLKHPGSRSASRLE
jgi:hypothetical protein